MISFLAGDTDRDFCLDEGLAIVDAWAAYSCENCVFMIYDFFTYMAMFCMYVMLFTPVRVFVACWEIFWNNHLCWHLAVSSCDVQIFFFIFTLSQFDNRLAGAPTSPRDTKILGARHSEKNWVAI